MDVYIPALSAAAKTAEWYGDFDPVKGVMGSLAHLLHHRKLGQNL
jgi:hypothetical protein